MGIQQRGYQQCMGEKQLEYITHRTRTNNDNKLEQLTRGMETTEK